MHVGRSQGARAKLAASVGSIRGCLVWAMKAELRNRTSCWMVDDGSPARAAAVAAPIRRLCVLYWGVPMLKPDCRTGTSNVDHYRQWIYH